MKSLRSIIVVLVSMLPLSTYAQSKEVEYNARRAATIQAMDSVLKYAQIDPGTLMKYADDKCKAFKNDSVLMDSIADAFSAYGGFHDQSIERFRELKRIHPKYLGGYLSYAARMHSVGIQMMNGQIQLDPKYRKLAKEQIDSIKKISPNSEVPYISWLKLCSKYVIIRTIQEDFRNEVAAYDKAFPQSNAYYVAGNLLSETKLDLSQFSKDDQNRYSKTFLNFTREFYDALNPQTMTPNQLTNSSLYYYTTVGRWRTIMDSLSRIDYFEKGRELAQRGIEKHPDSIRLQRLFLWHSAELMKYDKVQEIFYATEATKAATTLIEHSDILGKDYFYYALALQKLKKETEAIEMYWKALNKGKGLRYNDREYNCDSTTAYNNIIVCYNNMKDYKNAIAITQIRNEILTKKGKQLAREDLATLGEYYDKFGRDTLNSIEERYGAFLKSDSLYTIIQERINDGTYTNPVSRDGSLMSGMYTYRRMQNSVYVKSRLKRDEVSPHEIARQLVDILKPIAEKSRVERNYLGTAYVQLMMYYDAAKDYKNALENIQLAESVCPGIISDMGFNSSYETIENSFKKKIRGK